MDASARCAHAGMVGVGLVLFVCLAILGGRSLQREFAVAVEAPLFTLKDTDGNSISLAGLRGNVVVLVFASTRCTVSIDYSGRLTDFADRAMATGRVKFLMIDVGVTADDKKAMDELRLYRRLTEQHFPTLVDDGRRIARLYGVERTPTVCVIDPAGKLRYRGAFDDSRDPRTVRHQYCQEAVKNLLAEQDIEVAFTQAFGRLAGRPK